MMLVAAVETMRKVVVVAVMAMVHGIPISASAPIIGA
jgi:hypothetical protein